MAKKITYLLGAGASANTIPVVADMQERMKEISDFFAQIMHKCTKESNHTKIPGFNQDLYNYLDVLNRINDNLKWLIKEGGNFYTIDTLAKKFYLTSDYTNLIKLKKCLITYFTLEQVISIPTTEKKGYNFTKDNLDKRYGSFIASITNKRYPIGGGNTDGLASENLEFELSKYIKVLSWNYDMQIELSIKSMLTKTIIQHIKREFQIFPNKESKNEVNNVPIDLDRFAMVKLNGDAIWERVKEQKFKNIPTIFDGNTLIGDEDLLVDLILSYTSNMEINLDDNNDLSPAMSFNFAREHDKNFRNKYRGHSKNFEIAELIASETEILVVIVYSFPIFNREIDNRLFKKMGNLKKVYIQDKEPDKIKSTMQNAFEILQSKVEVGMINDYEIKEEHIVDFYLDTNVSQFAIPYELFQ